MRFALLATALFASCASSPQPEGPEPSAEFLAAPGESSAIVVEVGAGEQSYLVQYELLIPATLEAKERQFPQSHASTLMGELEEGLGNEVAPDEAPLTVEEVELMADRVVTRVDLPVGSTVSIRITPAPGS